MPGCPTRVVVCCLAAVLTSAVLAGARPTAVLAEGSPPADASSVPVITNLGAGLKFPGGIATGPDGNLWIADAGSAAIVRSTSTGQMTTFALDAPTDEGPSKIVASSDGYLWFNNADTSHSIARMTTDGEVTRFPLAGALEHTDLAAGPDGVVWFSRGPSEVGRITSDGVVTSFPLSSSLSPAAMTVSPDGSLWFTTYPGNGLGRVTLAGAVKTFALPGPGNAVDVASAANGTLWFTNSEQRSIGRMTLAGVVTMYTTPFVGYPGQITPGADGRMWFANREGYSFLGSITAGGAINVSYPKAGQVPVRDLTAGPDGNIWSTGDYQARLVRTTPAGVSTTFHDTIEDPVSLTTGPDGALWFATFASSIATIGDDGSVTRRSEAGALHPSSIATGPDGNLWIANGTSIVRRTPSGEMVTFPTPTYPPNRIAAGPDGNMWFTFGGGHLTLIQGIARITPDGTVTAFTAPAVVDARRLVAGPDGNVWFASAGGIHRITPAGQITTFPEAAAVASHGDLTFGPDGALWFVTTKPSGAAGKLARMTLDGHVTTFLAPGTLSQQAIATGPDGALWVSTEETEAIASIARVTTTGVLKTFADPSIRGITSIAAGPDGAMWFTNAGNNSIGRAATGPAAPSGVVAAPGKAKATISWSTPFAGSEPITTMTATASPGGATCTWTAGPAACTITGLSPGTEYSFTVTASNAVATSEASLPATTTPWDGSAYHPLTPSRILDSRVSAGPWSSPLVAGAARDLQVTSLGGGSDVPATASAVLLNVTATGATHDSFVTAWPSGAPPPVASNLNFGAGQTIPNLVTVKVGAGGRVSFANAVGAVDLVADVVGYYDDGEGPGGLFNGVTPQRLLDSRTENGGWDAPLVAGAPRDLVVREPHRSGGVPATATAVVANVTVTGGTADSFLSVWPSGLPQPGVSNLNFATGQTIPNLAVIGIGDGGAIRLANAVGSADVVVDVVGYFDPSAGSRFHAIDPTRVLDDRIGLGLLDSWGPGETRVLPVAGAAGSNVPTIATDVVANMTATGATAGTFITVFPHDVARPTSSNLNVGAGQTIPNLVTVKIGTVGSVDLYNAAGAVDLVADVVGYYAAT